MEYHGKPVIYLNINNEYVEKRIYIYFKADETIEKRIQNNSWVLHDTFKDAYYALFSDNTVNLLMDVFDDIAHVNTFYLNNAPKVKAQDIFLGKPIALFNTLKYAQKVGQVVYDPTAVPLAKILEIYFKTHDPTQLNRQGADIGEQYRSVIFYQNENQKKVATEVKEMLGKAGIWRDPIVTAIEPHKNFYKAENYHQDYFENNPKQPYCQMVVNPKVEKFEKLFKDYLKK